jgi:tetratricopeptide (TPR) repeat protein
MAKRIALAGALLMAALAAFGASAFFEKGEALFVQNKPQDAQPLLESALNEDPANEKIYLYLGIIYQQLGDPQKAIDILKRGLNVATTYKDLFYYNIGNDFFSRKQYSFAEESYNSALATNRNLAEAYLNRANARLQLQNYGGALADYTLFLQLKPQDVQRPQIEEVMRLIRQMLDSQEAKRKEQEARQKALMNEVLNSLTNAGEDTKNLSVESLQFKHDTEDVDIKD